MNVLRQTAITALALAATLALASNAHAAAYGLAYNNFTNGIIDIFQPDGAGGACSLIGNPVSVPGVFQCGAGASIVNLAGQPSNTSGSSATLNGAGPALSDVGTGPRDAGAANTGAAVGTPDNTYTPLGVLGSNYSRGDSQLISEQAITFVGMNQANVTSTINAVNIAETALVGQGQSTAAGNLSSSTLLRINFSLATPGQVAITFDADPYMEVFLDPGAGVGSFGQAQLTANITITPQDGSLPLFQWVPDGASGGIAGGTELFDPSSLNQTLTQQVPGSQIDDPTMDASVGMLAAAGLTYSAYSGMLAVGDYSLTIAVGEFANAQLVPEPTSLALVALGLLGLGAGAHRHNRKMQAHRQTTATA